MPTATLAQQAHHDFISEVRSNVVHLLSACASARLMLAHAADHEPRQLIHAVVHGVFGDLAQPTDAKQFGEWLSRVLELHLVLLPNPLPAGGLAAPPLLPAQAATAFLQPGCMVAELTRGYLRHLPRARRFLQLCLSAPLNTILYEASLDLSPTQYNRRRHFDDRECRGHRARGHPTRAHRNMRPFTILPTSPRDRRA